MRTDLFLAATGMDLVALPRAVPPACLAAVQAGPVPRRDGADLLLALPEWHPRQPTVHLLPSFAPLGTAAGAFRFELSARVGGEWSPWVATATVGDTRFPALPPADSALVCDVDVLTCRQPSDAVRLRIRWRGAMPARWVAGLSATDAERPSLQLPDGRAVLAVPPLSQMDAPAGLGSRICSPTCVAMVLAYWQRQATPMEVAAEVFNPELDIYGVWPAAIRAAALRGLAGYLLRFPDMATATWCLAHGLPVIASVRYAAGALDGAAIAATGGHLVVLTGWRDGEVLVNDPAAPDASTVARRYPAGQLGPAWLNGSGVGYVLFDPDRV